MMNTAVKKLLNNYKIANFQYAIRRSTPKKRSPVYGIPAWDARSRNIKQIVTELNKNENDDLHYLVDIGLPYTFEVGRKEFLRRNQILLENKNNRELERSSKNSTLNISTDDYYAEWLYTDGPRHIRRSAEHYGIYEHLFGDAYFYPVTPISISFKNSENEYTPVYFGNTIKPKEATSEPLIDIGYDKSRKVYHTLVLSSLDSHLAIQDGEYIHWFVENIPDGDITKGNVKIPYLQPFPTHGTGYHRFAFVLYEHEKPQDYSNILQNPIKENDPSTRTFCTYDFYRARQDDITPCGLGFFQSQWDSSVQKVFHNLFNIEEPRYVYDFPEDEKNPQTWFPIDQPFDKYLDKYRDPKEISREVLESKLKDFHPFVKPVKPRFPNLHTMDDLKFKASWIQVRAKKERLGWGTPYNSNIDIIDPE